MEDAVVDKDVARVALEGDVVIATGHVPAVECDVVGPDGVDAIGVEGAVLAVGGVVDVDVLEEEVLGQRRRHGPHLALDEPRPPDDRVCELTPVDHHRAMGEVTLSLSPVIPDLAVAIERADAVAVEEDIIAAKVPDGALVLEANGHGDGQPVVDVGAPEKAAVEVDVDIVQPHGGDVGVHVVHLAGQDDEAILVAVAVERLGDGGGVILVVLEGLQVAERAALLLGQLLPVLARRDINGARLV